MHARVRGLAAVALVLAAAPIAASPAEAARAKAKLRVQGVSFVPPASMIASSRYPATIVESNGRGRFGVEYKLENSGRARSHNSHPTVFVGGRKIATELVGPIAPGKSVKVADDFNARFRGPGRYELYVCPSPKDCGKRAKRVRFSALPRRWRVDEFSATSTLTGTAPLFAANSSGMTFDFFGTVTKPGDVYHLWLATGIVNGSVSGDDGTCTYSGNGAVSHSPWEAIPPRVGYLLITPELDGYFAEVNDEGHAYISTQSCPSISYSNDEVVAILPLQTLSPEGRVDRSMESDATVLSGDYNIATGVGSGRGTGKWTFRADLP